MNDVVKLCVAYTLGILLFFIIYFIPYFSTKKIKKGKFDILQFIQIFLTPVVVIPYIYFLRNAIIDNTFVLNISLPKYIGEMLVMGFMYFFVVGLGIHATSVLLLKHMKDLKRHKVWEVNEYFHNKFSHLMIFTSAALVFFSFALIELNYPTSLLTKFEIQSLVVCGIVSGIILGIGSVEGSVPKSMGLLIYILSMILGATVIINKIDYHYFPYTIFVEIMFATSILTILLYRYVRKGFPEIVPNYFFD